MDRFDLKTKCPFGDNALDRLRDNPYDKAILVIADPFVVESGMINSLTRRLDEAHKEYHVYSDVILILRSTRSLTAFSSRSATSLTL